MDRTGGMRHIFNSRDRAEIPKLAAVQDLTGAGFTAVSG